jgi:hypothetical protein
MRGRRVTAAALALGLVFLAACGDDDDSDATGASGESGTTAPEERRVSDAEVATGLQQVDDLVDQVAERVSDGDDDGAVEANDQINPVWFSVEGTVQENDPDAYITFEDQFAVLTRAMDEADSVGAEAAAETVSDTVSSYLADHPG